MGNCPAVNRDLAAALDDGILTRSDALAAVPRWVLEHAVQVGQLVRLCPSVYADPGRAADPEVRFRAALTYAAGQAALSHTSALALWGLGSPRRGPGHLVTPVHVVTPLHVRIRSTDLVTVHRRNGLVLEPPDVRKRGGLPLTTLERSIVDSWGILPVTDRRALVIEAVAGRHTTAARLRSSLVLAGRITGCEELQRLLDQLAAGCRSPLEIWGLEHVFTGRGMPRFARQVPVQVRRRTVYLDVYAERERVDFELDGAAWHGSPAQRERDVRRDAALAALGILVVRFTHLRLTTEPDAVRRDVLAILAARQR
jgi:very-short-patch-repair endonuclease